MLCVFNKPITLNDVFLFLVAIIKISVEMFYIRVCKCIYLLFYEIYPYTPIEMGKILLAGFIYLLFLFITISVISVIGVDR